MNAENTASHCGGKDGQSASRASLLPTPSSDAPGKLMSSLLDIGCTQIKVVNMPIDHDGHVLKSAHHSLPSTVPLNEFTDDGNDQRKIAGKKSNASSKPVTNSDFHYTASESEFLLKAKHLLIDTNRKLDLLLEKMTQMERSFKAIEKKTKKHKFLEKHIKACTPVRKKKAILATETSKNGLVIPDRLDLPFSPVSSLLELKKLEEMAKDVHFVNYVKMQVYRIVDVKLEEGKGQFYSRRIVDLFFTRSFLTQCTWSGRVSRKKGTSKGLERKIRLKDFNYVINMFYETATYANPTISKESTETFLKDMLKQNAYRPIHGPQKKTTPIADVVIVTPNMQMLPTMNIIDSLESYEIIELDPLEIETELKI